MVAGKRREIGLGGFPAVTLADARTEARRLAGCAGLKSACALRRQAMGRAKSGLHC